MLNKNIHRPKDPINCSCLSFQCGLVKGLQEIEYVFKEFPIIRRKVIVFKIVKPVFCVCVDCCRDLDRYLNGQKPAIPPCLIIEWKISTSKIFEFAISSWRSSNMDSNVVQLSECSFFSLPV